MSVDAARRGRPSWADVAVAHQRSLRAFEEFVRPVLAKFGLESLGVQNVLFLLAVGRDERKTAEVVRNERYVGSNASYALDALEKAGLVERRRDVEDRRMRIVAPTYKGRRLVDAVKGATVGKHDDVAMALEAVSRFVADVTRVPEAEFAPAAPDVGLMILASVPLRDDGMDGAVMPSLSAIADENLKASESASEGALA